MASFNLPANPLSTPSQAPAGLDPRDGFVRSGPQRVGIYALMLYLFVVVTRLPEIFAIYLGTSGSIVLLSTALAGVLVIFSGSFRNIGVSRLTIYILLLHVWLCVAVPFSLWRGGSTTALIALLQLVPMYPLVVLLIRNEKQLRLVLITCAAAALFILIYTTIAAGPVTDDERLTAIKGRFGNSNDLAMFLLMGLPFWIYLAVGSRFHFVVRLLAGLEIAAALFQCLRTGSRGALLTLMLTGVVLFFVSSMANKARIGILVIVTVLIFIPLVPDAVRVRLASLLGSTVDESAAQSSAGRFDLLKQSLTVTAQYPLFGTGLGMYSDASAEVSLAAGSLHVLRQAPHNAFTTLSAESGIPAAGFYVLCLFAAGAAIWKARRIALATPGMQDFSLMCNCVALGLGIFVFNNFFFSLVCDLFFYLICGLCVACLALAQQWADLHRRGLASAPAGNQAPAFSLSHSTQGPGRHSQAAAKPFGSNPYGNVPWARKNKTRP